MLGTHSNTGGAEGLAHQKSMPKREQETEGERGSGASTFAAGPAAASASRMREIEPTPAMIFLPLEMGCGCASFAWAGRSEKNARRAANTAQLDPQEFRGKSHSKPWPLETRAKHDHLHGCVSKLGTPGFNRKMTSNEIVATWRGPYFGKSGTECPDSAAPAFVKFGPWLVWATVNMVECSGGGWVYIMLLSPHSPNTSNSKRTASQALLCFCARSIHYNLIRSVLFCFVRVYLVLFYPILSPILYPTHPLSHPTLSYRIPSYPTLSIYLCLL